MKRHLLYWFPIVDHDVHGKPYACELPDLIDASCGRTLLSDAIGMPKKEPISFENAVRRLSDEQLIAFYGHDYQRHDWLEENFVNWISEQGYHIEFTGDEFELINMPVVES